MNATEDLLADTQPAVRHLELNGVPVVAVGLSGIHGYGREMLLDLTDWNHVSSTITQH